MTEEGAEQHLAMLIAQQILALVTIDADQNHRVHRRIIELAPRVDESGELP